MAILLLVFLASSILRAACIEHGAPFSSKFANCRPGSIWPDHVGQQVHWFDQTLDHFAPLDRRTFRQRYFVNLGHFRAPDGPVFLRICGEAPCGGVGDDYLLVLARKLGAAVVALEHRFYGESLPFQEHTAANLSYLSSKQAIFDLAAFRVFYQRELDNQFSRGVGGASNPWVSVGISYAGALSAWFRLKFPHLTRGSLASSGVVQAILDFTAFDAQVATSAGQECAAALMEITSTVDDRLSKDAAKTKALFGAATVESNGDFRLFLADAAVFAVQYGLPDELCAPLLRAKAGGVDLLAAYADYVKSFFVGHFGASLGDYDRTALQKTDPKLGSRTWLYQVCTEVAFFETAPPARSVRSPYLDVTYYKGLCADVFGNGTFPDVDSTNIYYGGAGIASSRIFFTNGSQDPWCHASKTNSSAHEPAVVMRCHNCGHGVDFRGCPQWPNRPEGDASLCAEPGVVLRVREQMEALVRSWTSSDPALGVV